MIIHVVSAGETLWQLAVRYGTDVNAIQQINQLPDPNRLLIGQAILIPSYPRMHTVVPGETLAAIAARYEIDVDEIANANQLSNPSLIYPGMQLVIPVEKPAIEVNAYTYQKDVDAAASVDALGSLFTYISPFSYKVTEQAALDPLDDRLLLDAANANEVVPMMVVTNFSSTQTGSNLMHVVLSDPELQEKLIQNILSVMDDKGYRGLNIDFEYVLPEDRDSYTAFVQLAADRLHPKGYFVSTALAPKTSANQQGVLYEAHDYAAHGKIADFVILMTYEWGWRGAPPQAISPVNQMHRVVEYALSEIPADKIFLGFQIYARDWLLPHIQGQIARTFSPQEAIRIATDYGAVIQYDAVAQSPFFRYTDSSGQEHEVWFEDARSARAKFGLITEYGLRGVSYWALGYAFPQNWALLDGTFTVKKLTQ